MNKNCIFWAHLFFNCELAMTFSQYLLIFSLHMWFALYTRNKILKNQYDSSLTYILFELCSASLHFFPIKFFFNISFFLSPSPYPPPPALLHQTEQVQVFPFWGFLSFLPPPLLLHQNDQVQARQGMELKQPPFFSIKFFLFNNYLLGDFFLFFSPSPIITPKWSSAGSEEKLNNH